MDPGEAEHVKRTERGDNLARFGNAIRDLLDLEPIYQVGRQGKYVPKQASEAARFCIVHSLPQTSTRKRALS